MPNLVEKLTKALEATGYIEVLQSASNVTEEGDAKGGKIAIQLRVESESVQEWLTVVDFLLQEEEDQEDEEEKWSLHICKTFLRSEGRLGFVWTVGLTSPKDTRGALKDISRALRTFTHSTKNTSPAKTDSRYTSSAVKQAAQDVVSRQVANQDREPRLHISGGKADVYEMPLIGVTEDRNKLTSGGKGARFLRSGP